jgi:lipocalin
LLKGCARAPTKGFVEMTASRSWLGSGAVLAGVGAAMLFGAGSAAADTDAATPDDASVTASTPATSTGVGRVARANRGSDARRPLAGAAAIAGGSTIAGSASAVPDFAVPDFAGAAGVRDLPVVSAAAVRAAAAVPTGRTPAATRRGQPPTPPPVVAPIPAVPSSDPVDPAQFAGTYYEQGSVKQFFSIGLVNTQATYSVNPDGTIKVQNSGNYFFNRGPKSSITGSAVPVNETNTALNVGFGGTPSANPPGNYTILAKAPDYSWIIVSDPSGQSGYILTREKNISPQQYQELLTQARALGVRGNITPTTQFR